MVYYLSKSEVDSINPVEEQIAILTQGAAEVIATDELRRKLARGTPLVAKLGVDPTAPVITLGHAVVLRRLAAFQRLGHRAVFLIGDETGRVGDPSGRSDTRPALDEEAVEAAAAAFLEQVGAILDLSEVEVRRNSEWLRPLGFSGALQLASRSTVARMLEREDFLKRFRENQPIYLHELIYPLMQGYDSVALRADVELGATEQKFNLLMGRQLQRDHDMEPQVLVLMPILTGLDGSRKMSKSLGNYIAINESPDEMFGKLMSIPDHLIQEYLLLAADVAPQDVAEQGKRLETGSLNPRDLKAEMAERTVALYHGTAAAQAAHERFSATFARREVPKDAPLIRLSDADRCDLVAVLVRAGLASSSSEARRLADQGAVRIGEMRLSWDQDLRGHAGATLRVGKHRFLRLEA